MDVLLPVFQLVYFVSHFLYSLVQSVVLTWHLLTTMIPLHHLRLPLPYNATHHPVPDNAKGLAKTPRHLGIILGLTSPSVASVAALVVHAASYGVRYVSVYDIVGGLRQRKSEVMKHVRKAAGSVYDFRESGVSENEAEKVTETLGNASSMDGAVGNVRHRKSEVTEHVRESTAKDGAQEGAGSEAECEEGHQGSAVTKEQEKCQEEEKTCQKLTSTSSGKVSGSWTKLPECSDRRPLITIQFLGLKDGRQKLASAAEKLARNHARKLHTIEGSADINLVDRNLGIEGENLSSGLRKRKKCSSETCQSDGRSTERCQHTLKNFESLASGDQSSEMEVRKRSGCSAESSKSGRSDSESCPSKLRSSEHRASCDESSCGELRTDGDGDAVESSSQSSEGIGKSSGNSSYNLTPENLASGGDESFMELRKQNKLSLGCQENSLRKLRNFEHLPSEGKSHLRIIPNLHQVRDDSNTSSLGLCKGPQPTATPTHSRDTPSSPSNQFKAKTVNTSSSPEHDSFLKISPVVTKTSHISRTSSLGLCRDSGHIDTHPIGLPTALDIAEEVCLGLPDPELLVTLGLNSTLGYPPWLLRTSEIHFLDVSEGVVGLRKVMEAYAGCEQRWGR